MNGARAESDPPPDVTIVRGGICDIPALRPLWLAMHRHHSDVMPELAPYVAAQESWDMRSKLYVDLLRKRDTALLLARRDQVLVGYGIAHVLRAADTWLSDTWVTRPRVGEIESLSVAPDHRGMGVGTLLLRRLQAELSDVGITEFVVGALAGNADAIRLYQRHGYTQTWVYLTRSGHRGGETTTHGRRGVA